LATLTHVTAPTTAKDTTCTNNDTLAIPTPTMDHMASISSSRIPSVPLLATTSGGEGVSKGYLVREVQVQTVMTSSTITTISAIAEQPESHEVHIQSANPFKALAILNSNKFLLCLSLSFFFYDLAASGMVSVFFLYSEYRYGWNELNSGAFLFCFGLVAVLGQIALLPRTLPEAKWGERKTIIVGGMWMGCAYLIIGFASIGWLVMTPSPIILFIWVILIN
jgi:Na+/melibiose symporter-like transporter